MDEQNYYEGQASFMPNSEGPLRGPFPNPQPVPWPWPPNWWRCLRWGPVSGRYEGPMTTSSRYRLDLRVDIDPRYPNSPVMNRISGDFYEEYIIWSPGNPRQVRVYRESWIVDAPQVTWSNCLVVITGPVRYWQGNHLAEDISVRIPWASFQPAGPAEVTFSVSGFGNVVATYSCARMSDCFRDMTLEVDVCQSINAAPIVPSYDTNWHLTRPANLPQRTLTIEEAYREAGICVTINAGGTTIINDSAPQFTTWSAAELHDALEINFSQFAGTWPAWNLWGLLAGTFDTAGVGGIMFDAAAAFGGAGEPPERQGFAVFRNHQWFNNLVAGVPANQNQAWSMRHFLYTWVHEAGHAFNLLHSWNKNRPDALSWMNYDWRYDQRNPPAPPIASTFWSRFTFRFDDEELIHMRHGDRASVIMGGDPWSSGGHLEAPAGAMGQLEGKAPIELLLRSKEYFEFMEPVVIEFRLRNLLVNLPLDVDTRLHPEYGGVIVYIRRPDGQIVEYAPIMCKLGTPEIQTLKPSEGAIKGEDRYSEDIFLSYGTYGFYFDKPGQYLVRAMYQGSGDVLIYSNVHRMRVGNPPSEEADRIAQDFFTYQVGMSLYLNGSRSPFLSNGMELLESIADRYKDTMLGAKVATTLANSMARPFFRIQDNVLTMTHSADPEKALALTEPTLKLYKREKAKSFNIAYHRLVRNRTEYMISLGQKAEAKKEVATLHQDLAARGVNEPVLNEIKAYEESIQEGRTKKRK